MKTISLQNIKKVWLFIMLAFFALAFASIKNVSSEPVFADDFEQYRTNNQIASAYQTWDDGAVLKAFLDKEHVNSGDQAMRIEMIGPNERTGATIGSIYHYLPNQQRNWTSGTAVRFWVANPSNKILLLTFNFKEQYNEYWAANTNGVFFLEPESGKFQKKEIEYGNLPIPASYQGYLVIPFFSFSVPDWNTALGNKVLDLRRVDSFSFGLTISEDLPIYFFLDDIQVIDNNQYLYLEIYNKDNMYFIPDEGEIRLQLNAYLVDPEKNESKEVEPNWRIQPEDSLIQIDQDGKLTIPSASDERDILVSCEYAEDGKKYFDEFQLSLISNNSPSLNAGGTIPNASTDNERAKTAGSEQSSPFESWAYHNRLLFVVISMSIVLVLVIALSAFQKRI